MQLNRCSTLYRLLIALFLSVCGSRLYAEAQEPAAQTTAPTVMAQPDVSGQLAEARRLLAAFDYSGADRSLRETIHQVPASAGAHFLLGFTLLHEQKPAEAIVEYMQGAQFKEPGADELIGFAAAQAELKQVGNAERSLAAAAKLAPERPRVWYLLGRGQFEAGHWADAERSFANSLRLNPQQVQAETYLGLVQEQLQHTDAAIAAYRAANALQESVADKNPQPYLALGMLLRRQGKTAEAVPLLTMATYARVPDPLAHQELGLAYEQLHRYDEALGEMKTAVYLAPEVQALHFFLGRIYRETGYEEQAAQEFARAARLSTSNARS